MAIDEVLINVAPGETRVALMDGERLVELLVSRAEGGSVAGNIYRGRVERALPGIQAAFVTLGLERAGFLGVAEVRPRGPHGPEGDRITDYVSEGDTVLVQVLQDPMPDKGAKLTTHVTLPGRHLVYTPGQAGIRMSRRIDSEAERDRLATLMEELAAEDEGYILRTVAAGADREGLARDMSYLRANWSEIEEKLEGAEPPACVFWDLAPLRRVLRDEATANIRRIVVDDAQGLAEANAFCERMAPDMTEKLERHDGPEPLFEAHGVEDQIEAALEPRVGLASGGSILIEEVAAVTAIDVNTGGRMEGTGPEETARLTNLEAVTEIARQLRLRNIGGHVVIDFVPMRQRQHGGEVLDALRAAVEEDRIPTYLAGFTRLGLVELTRERRRGSLARVLLEPTSAAGAFARQKSRETVVLEALRRVQAESRAHPGAALAVTAHPSVIEALEGPFASALEAVEGRLGRALDLVADEGLPGDRFDVTAGSVREDDNDEAV